MKKLVIDRQRWLRGEGGGSSALLRPSDCKMCCLGFYCLLEGLDEEQIKNIGMPSELILEVVEDHPSLSPLVRVREEWDEDGALVPVKDDTDVCNALATANDDEKLDAAEREAKIISLFAQIDIEVEFIN